MSDDLKLASEFPAATREQWLKLVGAVLKGAPFDKKLVGRTYDGLTIAPLYERGRTANRIAVRPNGPWQVLQRADHPDPAAANAQALQDLENGATGLMLVFGGATGAYGFGLPSSEQAIAQLLDGVFLAAGISLELDLPPQADEVPQHLAAVVTRRGIAPGATNIRFGLDPLGAIASAGASPMTWPQIAAGFARSIGRLADQGFSGPFAAADGRLIHAAGGSEAQELAYTLAVAIAYLRALEAGGIPLEDGRRMIFFRLAGDADQLLTMAKFRALRKLWARVEQACGLTSKPAFVCAETAWRMMTRRDPWLNMLRATVAVVAAGLGGADSITVLPHTAALGLADAFARRLARNTQLILLEESNLAKVSDPAAGSGGMEDLTQQLCRAAWSLLQEIERHGGIWSALERGLIQGKVAAVRAQREQAVAHRRDALTGTSEFPDIHEAPASVLDVKPVTVTPDGVVKIRLDPLPRVRLAEPFEALRDASDQVLAQTGSRPKIFLANLGPLSAFIARATFAKNFFEAGGIEAVTNDGFKSREEMTAAFHASGAKLACLCSSDEVYAKEAVEAARALAGAAQIYLAGRPRELEAALKSAGVSTFIFSDCDTLATLQAAHDILRRVA
jgi:methylmalonyl-CoA mutase